MIGSAWHGPDRLCDQLAELVPAGGVVAEKCMEYI